MPACLLMLPMLFMILGFLCCEFTYPVISLTFIFQRVTVLTADRAGYLFVASNAADMISAFQARFISMIEMLVFSP